MGYCAPLSRRATIHAGGIVTMKLHTKSLLSSLGNVRLPNTSRAESADPMQVVGIGLAPTANLQALASELHQSATQGLFEYPRNWVLIAKVSGVLLIAGTML